MEICPIEHAPFVPYSSIQADRQIFLCIGNLPIMLQSSTYKKHFQIPFSTSNNFILCANLQRIHLVKIRLTFFRIYLTIRLNLMVEPDG